MTPETCFTCDGRGIDWGETCIGCGGNGEVCGECGGMIADGECLSCDAPVDDEASR